MGKDLMSKTSKAMATKAKIDKCDIIKELWNSKRNCHQSEQEIPEIPECNYLSDRKLISRVNKKLKQIYKKKNPIKKWVKDMKRHSSK